MLLAHYGCGKNIQPPPWLNIDSFDPLQFPIGPKVPDEDKIYRCDLTRPHPFPGSHFTGAYCEDFIEHLSQEQLTFFLLEVHRTLIKGGEIRLSWPSFEKQLDKLASTSSWPNFKYEAYERWCHKHFPTKQEISILAAKIGYSVTFGTYRDPNEMYSFMDSREKQAESNCFANLRKENSLWVASIPL